MSVLLAASTTATTVANAAASTAKPVSATSLMFQLMLGLAVVLGIIWVGSRLVRGRFGVSPGRRRPTPLAVLGRQTLGKGVQLAVVRAGADTWLLGVTAHQITRLGRYREDPTEAVQAVEPIEPAAHRPTILAAPSRPVAPRLPARPVPATLLQPAARLQSTIRQMQERTLRRG